VAAVAADKAFVRADLADANPDEFASSWRVRPSIVVANSAVTMQQAKKVTKGRKFKTADRETDVFFMCDVNVRIPNRATQPLTEY
jgi:hypothetical protein